MHTDLDTLATALYVKVDDELKARPELNRWRPRVGVAPKITDAELITVAVMQSLLGYHDEALSVMLKQDALGTSVAPRAGCHRVDGRYGR